MNIKVCLSVLLALVLVPAINAQIESRIVGGFTTDICTVPYLVNLRRDGTFKCGGTLVTPQFVVTAYHCVRKHRPSQFVVTGGSSFLSEGGVKRNVSRIILPASFSKVTLHMDVAILKLESSMIGENIQTINLCSRRVPIGHLVTVSGWGLTSEGGKVSEHVRSVGVPVIPWTKCKEAYEKNATVTNSMMCASDGNTKDSCNGDSGGPMVYRNELCGIVSWGFQCANAAYPGVYTNVNAVKSFIQAAITRFA